MLKAGNEKNADGEFQSPSLLSVCCDGARLRSLKPRLTPASLTVCGRMIPSVSSSQACQPLKKVSSTVNSSRKDHSESENSFSFLLRFLRLGQIKMTIKLLFFIFFIS